MHREGLISASNQSGYNSGSIGCSDLASFSTRQATRNEYSSEQSLSQSHLADFELFFYEMQLFLRQAWLYSLDCFQNPG